MSTSIELDYEPLNRLRCKVSRFKFLYSEASILETGPRDKEQCPLNGGVPSLEVTSTKIMLIFRGRSLCPRIEVS